MRRVVLPAALLVLAWTSVAGAQAGPMPVTDLREHMLPGFLVLRDELYAAFQDLPDQGMVPTMSLRIGYLRVAVISYALGLETWDAFLVRLYTAFPPEFPTWTWASPLGETLRAIRDGQIDAWTAQAVLAKEYEQYQ